MDKLVPVFAILMILNVIIGFFSLGTSSIDLRDYVLKSDVIKAMSGPWNAQRFYVNNVLISGSSGENLFYSAADIDVRISRLNKVLAGKEKQ